MLVLSRNVYERLMIGNDITIQVVEVYRDRVVLGIDAPKNVRILREELIDRDRKPMRQTTTRSKGEND